MKLPFLTILLLFIVILSYYIKKSNKKMKQTEEKFWEKEHDANFSRKKSLGDLEYISFPASLSSLEKYCTSPEETEYMNLLKEFLSGNKKAVNFNGITNTDLKIRYGAANLSILSEYDDNYTELITTLNSLADCFIHDSLWDRAAELLEFATDIRTDICSSYTMLAEIYVRNDCRSRIHELIKKAEKADSFRSKSIISSLYEILDCTDPLKNNNHTEE